MFTILRFLNSKTDPDFTRYLYSKRCWSFQLQIMNFFSFRLNEFDKPAFSKNSTLATVFENLRFCFSNSSSMYGQKAKSERKKLRFQNISVDGTLIWLKNTLT